MMTSSQVPTPHADDERDDIEQWELDAAHAAIADYLTEDGKIDFARLNAVSVDGNDVLAM